MHSISDRILLVFTATLPITSWVVHAICTSHWSTMMTPLKVENVPRRRKQMELHSFIAIATVRTISNNGITNYSSNAVSCFHLLNWFTVLLGALIKLPWVIPGLPRCVRIAFDVILGAHPGQPPVPCLWSGSLGGWPQVNDVTT